jgi:hypothetical protein
MTCGSGIGLKEPQSIAAAVVDVEALEARGPVIGPNLNASVDQPGSPDSTAWVRMPAGGRHRRSELGRLTGGADHEFLRAHVGRQKQYPTERMRDLRGGEVSGSRVPLLGVAEVGIGGAGT